MWVLNPSPMAAVEHSKTRVSGCHEILYGILFRLLCENWEIFHCALMCCVYWMLSFEIWTMRTVPMKVIAEIYHRNKWKNDTLTINVQLTSTIHFICRLQRKIYMAWPLASFIVLATSKQNRQEWEWFHLTMPTSFLSVSW